jgi:hypothetical protein
MKINDAQALIGDESGGAAAIPEPIAGPGVLAGGPPRRARPIVRAAVQRVGYSAAEIGAVGPHRVQDPGVEIEGLAEGVLMKEIRWTSKRSR